jgi:hypothetical protein
MQIKIGQRVATENRVPTPALINALERNLPVSTGAGGGYPVGPGAVGISISPT